MKHYGAYDPAGSYLKQISFGRAVRLFLTNKGIWNNKVFLIRNGRFIDDEKQVTDNAYNKACNNA